jgi:hypothetical protein
MLLAAVARPNGVLPSFHGNHHITAVPVFLGMRVAMLDGGRVRRRRSGGATENPEPDR